MCKYCNDIKRKHQSYIYCPMCGKLYDPTGFIPTFVLEKKIPIDNFGRETGLSIDTSVEIKTE